jgi:hypothetical protein
MSDGCILLLGIDDELWKICFGKDEEWSLRLDTLPEDCPESQLLTRLKDPSLSCVVIMDTDMPHWEHVKTYYRNGGFVVVFGIEGVFDLPSRLSLELGLSWKFSGYTRHEYVLTDVGKQYLGDAITEQEYSKSNLLDVPPEDRIMVPKAVSWEEYLEENFGATDDEEMAEARASYPIYLDRQLRQVPLAMHHDKGKVTYLGFVNGDGNIPQIVRALCCGEKIEKL